MSRERIPYFDFYPSDFMHGVRGLSAQEVGVYTMMLCRIYEENGPVEYHVMRLSTYCGMREATFVKTVDRLIDLGKLELINGMISNHRAEAEISNRANKLKINSKAGKASAEKRQQKQRKNSTDVQQAFNHTDTDTDITSSLRSDVLIKPDFDAEFEQQFWPAYPRKVGKGQAVKAFRTARKQTDLETILVAVRRYADERRGENPEFTKHASTWLNGQCWLDEPTAKHAPQQKSDLDDPRMMWMRLGQKLEQQNDAYPDSNERAVFPFGQHARHPTGDDAPVRLAFSRSAGGTF